MKLIMENWKKFVEESNEPSGPPWDNPESVLDAVGQQGYETLGNDAQEVKDYIASMLTSDPVKQWEVQEWISTLDGEWIIHPDKEASRIEKQNQREKDPEYRDMAAKRNREDAEKAAAMSADYDPTLQKKSRGHFWEE